MSSEPQSSGEARRIDPILAEAAHTTPAAVRAELDILSASHADLSRQTDWAASAEEAFRDAIGMERKAQLEMRVSLGEEGLRFVRRTVPLAVMTLPELQEEYRVGRRTTLALLDELLLRPDSRTWTLGEEVAPQVYIVSLRNRLRRLGELVREAGV